MRYFRDLKNNLISGRYTPSLKDYSILLIIILVVGTVITTVNILSFKKIDTQYFSQKEKLNSMLKITSQKNEIEDKFDNLKERFQVNNGFQKITKADVFIKINKLAKQSGIKINSYGIVSNKKIPISNKLKTNDIFKLTVDIGLAAKYENLIKFSRYIEKEGFKIKKISILKKSEKSTHLEIEMRVTINII